MTLFRIILPVKNFFFSLLSVPVYDILLRISTKLLLLHRSYIIVASYDLGLAFMIGRALFSYHTNSYSKRQMNTPEAVSVIKANFRAKFYIL
jgi:myo-inositol catabolism protein IolC